MRMRLLFVAFAISFCALLWVAFSVARHIRQHDPGKQREASDDGANLPGMEAERIETRPRS
jgi:hypothetical protein